MKSLVCSDLHLHAHKDRVDRLQHCLDVLDWIFQTAIKHKVSHIFFLGDLFHERSKIDVMNYLRVFEIFMKYMIEDGINLDMHILVGNHDMYHQEKWDVNSVKPLNAIPRVNVIQQPTRMVVGGRKIDWLPHTENPIKELAKLKEKNGGAGDILFGHLSVNGAMLNTCYGTKADVIVEYDNDMVPVDVGIFADWKMTMLGHYHGAQQLSPTCEYVGSPLQLTFGEAFQQKHIIILDLDTLQKQYIINDFSPKHIIVNSQDYLGEAYDLNNCFVRLLVGSMTNREIMDMKRDIAAKYRVLSLDAKKKESKIVEDKEVIDRTKASLTNITEMMNKHLEQTGIPTGIDVLKLKQWGMKCLEKKEKTLS